VVGVSVGVAEGVKVDVGTFVGLGETDPVTKAITAALTGCANKKNTAHDNSTNATIRRFVIDR